MKYYFPIHLDGGNRGCEAIATGSAILLDERPERMIAYSRDVALDTRLGLAEYMTLLPCRRESYMVDRFLGLVNRLFHTKRTMSWRYLYPYRVFLRLISRKDVVISTGGDMLCYGNNQVIYTNNWLNRRGIKTILWACSMGPENQTQEKLETLHKFSLIYTRESLTYNYFRSLGLKNLCLLPDPAFILRPQSCTLPGCFQDGDVIGLNISSLTMGGMTLDSDFGREILGLIKHIVENTPYRILLIPHVTWNMGDFNQDDREMARLVYGHFKNPSRIQILDINNLNYCQIRYVISHCSMFIGARTHAVISAYSECVPAIALGYSIKSRGIAKDLGLDERLVVHCKDFSSGDLLSSFTYLDENKETIREHLQSIMPGYKQRTYQIREELSNMK